MELAEEATFESSRKKQFWESKNLYMTFKGNTRILGIKPCVGAGDFVGTGDFVEEAAVVVRNWDVKGIYPAGMGVFFMDSKIYSIGGHPRLDGCYRYPRQYKFVHEIITVPRLDFLRCISIPPLETAIPYPMIAKVKGDIYVLYGVNYYCQDLDPLTRIPPDVTKCFMVLEKKGDCEYVWSTLPTPPFYSKSSRPCTNSLNAVVGNKLYVYSGSEHYSYNVVSMKWEKLSKKWEKLSMEWEKLPSLREKLPSLRGYVGGSITLSMSAMEQNFVVIYADRRADWQASTRLELYAALVDGESNTLRIQHIPCATPDLPLKLVDVKLIEVKEEEEEEDHDSSSSSTFCMVFTASGQHGFHVVFSIVRVCLLEGFRMNKKQVLEGKEQKLLDAYPPGYYSTKGEAFLEVEVKQKRMYTLPLDLGFRPEFVENAFFN